MSLLQRTQRALESRDRIHIALNRRQNHDMLNAALSELDIVLVLLMGATDIAARVAHQVLSLPDELKYQAAWQRHGRNRWLDTLRKAHAPLAAVVDAPSEGANTLRILRSLRNSIHGAALQGTAYDDAGSPLQSLFRVPPGDVSAIRTAMNATGGNEAWGLKRSDGDDLYLDPGIFVDQLSEHVLRLLNALLALTPVEQLSHVSLTPADRVPPRRSAGDVFAPEIRQGIRWQLGFA